MAGRKIEGEAEARRHLAALARSGLELADWARREGVDGRSLNMWRVNLERRGRMRAPQRLVELVPAAAPRPRGYVVRCGRFSVELGDDFDQGALFRILEVVAEC